MTKLLLLPALLLGSVAMASNYDYEITPQIGYNIAEGNIDLDNHLLLGGEFQYNGFNSIIKPEFSVLYSKADYEGGSLDTDVWRVALNGVYEYDKLGSVIPLAKVGLGYETMSDPYTIQTGNTDSMFVDAGIGAKVPFTDYLALKLEAVYMLKYNDARYDSNLAFLVGLNFAFGASSQEAASEQESEPVVAAAVVETDEDNDGIVDSKDKCLGTPAGTKVDAQGCKLVVDSDGDGVNDDLDKCPNTPQGTKVDAEGCKVQLDDDKDGVFNDADICPNTPIGDIVNSDGCPKIVALNVNFENNSDKIKTESEENIQKYSEFLIKHTNYSAKIVGYTDSKGSASYNQKLSEKRAQAVVSDLISRGVNAKQLSSSGAGEADPIAENTTEEGRAKNRRIEAELTRN